MLRLVKGYAIHANSVTEQSTTTDRRRWYALAALVLPVVLVSMDMSILYLAIPHIGAALSPSPSAGLWILDIYGFVLAGLLIVAGGLGDRWGRRRLLMAGAALFGIASALGAFAPTPEILIAARALMGVGGATLMPSTLALIRTTFDNPAERTRAIGVWTAAFGGGGLLGPVIGGVLLEHFWWGSVFLVNVPVVILVLIAVRVLVREVRPTASARFDLVGAVISLVGVLALVYAMKHAAEIAGWDGVSTIALVVGVALLAGFVARQRRIDHPLVDLALFRSPIVVGALVAVTIGMFALLGPNMYIAQYLQLSLSMSPLVAGLWLLPSALAGMVGATVAPFVRARIGGAWTIAGGFALAAIGLVVIALTPPRDGLAMLIIGTAIVSVGVVTVMSLSTDIVVSASPTHKVGVASAMSETGSELGGALGIAVVGSIGAAVYRAALADHDLPAVARDSFASAVEVSHGLPAADGAALFDTAAAAFMHGVAVTSLLGAALMALLAIVVPILIRGLDERDATGAIETDADMG